MVQVFNAPQREQRPSFIKSVLGGIGQGISQGAESQRQMDRMSHESKLRQEEIGQRLQGDVKKAQADNEVELRDFQIVKDTFGDKFANLYRAAPVGGKTQLLQFGVEAMHRGLDLDDILGKLSPDQDQFSGGMDQNFEFDEGEEDSQLQPVMDKKPKSRSVQQEFNEYISSQDKDLTPQEKVNRGKERYTTGLPLYKEAGDKLRAFARDRERFDILEELEKSGKLPKNLGRVNVDKEGSLILPYLASKESQRFVKTLNEFSAAAKDTFGSRVTNFDLAQYMKRYPTLLNTEDGRKQILQQMRLVNQINSVYYKNLKDVYDKAGGVRNIDSDVADRFAEKMSQKEVDKIASKFKDIGSFDTLPSAQEFFGKKIKDKNTGEMFVSDGENWVPFQGGQ